MLAVALCTQLSVASMEARGVEDGQIIMVSSMSGHRVPPNPSTRSNMQHEISISAMLWNCCRKF